ncbi:MAG: helix-turn-helix domain-containing protein [Micromonosporaceae bacterium]
MSDAPIVGQRIREWRRYRGMPLKTLAGLAGLSVGYLSMVENGKRIVDRMSHLAAIAAALRVSVAELQRYPSKPLSPDHSAALAAVPEVRAALAEIALGLEPRVLPTAQLAEEVATVHRLRAACDYAALAQRLPPLLRALGSGDREVHGLLVQALYVTAFVLKYLGFADLAQTAAQQCWLEARDLEDPAWQAVSDFARLHCLPPELRPVTASRAVATIDQLAAGSDDRNVLQVIGMLHLTAAWSYAVANDQPTVRTHLAEASELADRLGDDTAGGFAAMWFGPTNVGFWKAGLAVELGEGGRVREIARELHPEAVASASRRASYYSDLGRGLAQERRDAEAIAHLVHAEHIAPQRVRTNPAVRETVAGLMRRARNQAADRPLRLLAQASGVF